MIPVAVRNKHTAYHFRLQACYKLIPAAVRDRWQNFQSELDPGGNTVQLMLLGAGCRRVGIWHAVTAGGKDGLTTSQSPRGTHEAAGGYTRVHRWYRWWASSIRSQSPGLCSEPPSPSLFFVAFKPPVHYLIISHKQGCCLWLMSR